MDLPPDLPKKWDLADALPKGWAVETVQDLIKPEVTKEVTPSQNSRLDAAKEAWAELMAKYNPLAEQAPPIQSPTEAQVNDAYPKRSKNLKDNNSYIEADTKNLVETIQFIETSHKKGLPIADLLKETTVTRMFEISKNSQAMVYLKSLDPKVAEKVEQFAQQKENEARLEKNIQEQQNLRRTKGVDLEF